jgi:maleate isomerase
MRNLVETEDHMGQLALQSAFEISGRRSFMRSAACASLCVAAPALNLLVGPANAASNWRGLVGCVKPTVDNSSLVDMIRLLPRGIGVVPVYLNFSEGTREEMQSTYANYEKSVTYLASLRCDTISIEGAPPFMLLGPDGEATLVNSWTQKYKTDMFTSSQNQVNVLRAMKIKKIFGVTPFGADLNKSYTKYFEDCGIGVVSMEGMDVPFRSIADVSAEAIYSFIKKRFLQHTGADAIYILASSLDALDIVAMLEQDLGVPVVQPTAARIWEIQRRLHVRQPIKGYGILLETLPA